jgi:hypothetical protein
VERFAFREWVRIMTGWRQVGLFGAAVLVAPLAPAWADAAWLGYKNNTNTVVIIQATDVVVVNGQARQGRSSKAHTLYPGEVAWDPIAAAGQRVISVYDPKANNKLLFQDKVDCNKNDIFLSLQLVQPPAVRGQPQPQPQLKLLPTVLPAQAPGILSPGMMPTRPGQPGTNPPSTPTQPGNRPPSTTQPGNRPPGK